MAGMMLGLGGDIGMGLLAGGNRPSYFELFMQGAISDMLRPAMQHVVAALAPRFPVLYRSQRWHDEIFLALLGALEWAHLRTQEASFAESFFGLKRVRYFPPSARGETPPPNWLRPIDQVGSMVCQLGVPYVKWKIEGWVAAQGGGTGAVADLGLAGDDSSEEDEEEDAAGSALATRGQRRSRGLGATLKKLFLRLWPYLNFSYEAIQFGYQFLYLVERTDWYSPGLQILRLRLERLGDDDRDRLEALASAVPGWRKLLNRGLMGAALAGILGMKFFQWYYSAQAEIPAKEKFIPPPPPVLEVDPTAVASPPPEDPALCPICRKERANHTMIPSGYVFCYPCIYNHVNAHGCCPVTNQATSPDDLRKIYPD